MVYGAHMIVFARHRRTFECKFAADVAGAVQAALAAEDIRSLDDVVDVLDEARLRNQSAAAVRMSTGRSLGAMRGAVRAGTAGRAVVPPVSTQSTPLSTQSTACEYAEYCRDCWKG
jgi:hypothetical protein